MFISILKGECRMLERIAIVGDVAFISLYVFAIIFVIIDEKKGCAISAKLQKKKWPTVVVLVWATIALVGVLITIFKRFFL